jgi:hypothetical protein
MQKRPLGKGSSGKGRVTEENKEGEYGRCTFYASMNMEHLNLLKSP